MASNELLQYGEVLRRLKLKIATSRQKALLIVNNELLTVYWEIGNAIAEQEQSAGWGSKIIERLASDLKSEFPDMKGLSPRNLRYMRDFSLAFPEFLQQPVATLQKGDNDQLIILQQLVAKLPWGHYQLLLTKLKTKEERIFYIQKSVENGWSRNILAHQIESNLYNAKGKLINNFSSTMPEYTSELSTEIFKDPYNFDFIMLGERAKERDLEDALMTHVTKVLLELGAGFAFMSRQKRFDAGGREFFVDLLFYHTKLRRHIIIELKIGDFEPEYVSKMNVYLGLADDQLRGEHDEPAIGLILCKTNNKIVAEYALRDTSKPIGIAEYKIAEKLPESIQGELPSIEEIEQRMDDEIKETQNPVDERYQLIKEKIKAIHAEEIQTPATFDILKKLYEEGLKMLYKELIDEVKKFEDNFFTVGFHWYCTNHNFNNQDQVNTFWQEENNLKNILEFSFQVRLDGFKKAGMDHNNSYHTLIFKIDRYYYSFVLQNYNNGQPFLKKLYHQPLQSSERIEISSIIMNAIMDDIERFLERLN